jgi:hypothetical protein
VNTGRAGSIPATVACHSCRASTMSPRSCSAARRVFFFARLPEALECPADGPRPDPDAGLGRQGGGVLGQGEVVVLRDQALERGFDLIPDHRLRTAPHRPGRAAPALHRLLAPAVDGGRADGEALGHRPRWRARLDRPQHP